MYKIAIDSAGNILSIFQGEQIFPDNITVIEIEEPNFSIDTSIYNNVDKFDEKLRPIPIEDLLATGKIKLAKDEKVINNRIVKLDELEKIEKGLYTPEELNNLLLEEKSSKLQYISSTYEDYLSNGYFVSKYLKITVDCRKNKTKDDLASVKLLLEYMTTNNIAKTFFRGYDNQSAGATIEQIKSLVDEMIAYQMDLFAKKDALKTEVENATTLTGIRSILWK